MDDNNVIKFRPRADPTPLERTPAGAGLLTFILLAVFVALCVVFSCAIIYDAFWYKFYPLLK